MQPTPLGTLVRTHVSFPPRRPAAAPALLSAIAARPYTSSPGTTAYADQVFFTILLQIILGVVVRICRMKHSALRQSLSLLSDPRNRPGISARWLLKADGSVPALLPAPSAARLGAIPHLRSTEQE